MLVNLFYTEDKSKRNHQHVSFFLKLDTLLLECFCLSFRMIFLNNLFCMIYTFSLVFHMMESLCNSEFCSDYPLLQGSISANNIHNTYRSIRLPQSHSTTHRVSQKPCLFFVHWYLVSLLFF